MPRINFEVSEEEKQLLDLAAETEHMQATAWARSFALRGARQIISQASTVKIAQMFESPFFQQCFNSNIQEDLVNMQSDMLEIMEGLKDDSDNKVDVLTSETSEGTK